jgi:hypothetical protein
VRREGRRIAGGFVLATGTLVVLLGFRPVASERLLAGYVLVLAAIALAALTRLARPRSRRAEYPSAFERALVRRPVEDAPPPQLAYTERELALGEGSAGYTHTRLLPLLRECAAAQLARRRGVDFAREPARARELLGDDVWDLIRPDRPPPEDRHASGLARAGVEYVVERLEAL